MSLSPLWAPMSGWLSCVGLFFVSVEISDTLNPLRCHKMESIGKSSCYHSPPVSLLIRRASLTSILKLWSFSWDSPFHLWHRLLAELHRAYLRWTQGGYQLLGGLACS